MKAKCSPYSSTNEKFKELSKTIQQEDEIRAISLKNAGYDIDPEEHVTAVLKKAIDYFSDLDRNDFKRKIKDIRKKTKRVLHKLEIGIEDQESLDELKQDIEHYFNDFNQYWTGKRKNSSMRITAEEGLTEDVI